MATPDGATALVVTVVSSSTFHAHADQEPARGKAAVRQAFADLFAQFPDLDFTQISLRTGPDFWVVKWKMSGTLAGADAGFEVDLIDLITVEDGLVKSKDSYIDGVAMQAQLPMVAAQ